MRYCSLLNAVKEVSRWAMNDYLNLRSLWLNFIREHPNIPDEVLKALAQDKKWLVRKEVAQRKQDLPEEVLEVLAQDEHWWVRLEFAERKQELSHEVLKVLAEDKEKIVRRALEARKG